MLTRNSLRISSRFLIALVITLLTNKFTLAQLKPLPIYVSCRQALLTRSYVLEIKNTSNQELNLWLQAKEKYLSFKLGPGKETNFGWMQGYHFDANNIFSLGAEGYDTVKERMPAVELSPWRISFPSGGGIALNLSQYFLQQQLDKHVKTPMQLSSSRILDLSLNQEPLIVLREGTERVFVNTILMVSIFSSKVHIPIHITASFAPFYDRSNGEIGVNQIRIEKVGVELVPQEYTDEVTKIVNEFIPIIFSKYVIYRLKKEWQVKLTRLVGLRTKVDDGRLDVVIF